MGTTGGRGWTEARLQELTSQGFERQTCMMETSPSRPSKWDTVIKESCIGFKRRACTMDSSASRPSRCAPAGVTGTPITGSGVAAATMPGRCAAPPAPAMMTCHMYIRLNDNCAKLQALIWAAAPRGMLELADPL
jgi:hypothetical protein